MLDDSVEEKYYYNDSPLLGKLNGEVRSRDRVYQWRRKYVRENKRGLFPTLTANMGTGGHNVPIIRDRHGIRKVTPRECARIQGFADTFKLPANLPDSSLYKQLGNSVTVPVVARVARSMYKALRETISNRGLTVSGETWGASQARFRVLIK